VKVIGDTVHTVRNEVNDSTTLIKALLRNAGITLVSLYLLERSGETNVPVRAVWEVNKKVFRTSSIEAVLNSIRKLTKLGLIEYEKMREFPFSYRIRLTERGKSLAERLHEFIDSLGKT